VRTSLLVMLPLAATLVVFVAGPAAAKPPSKTTKTTTVPPMTPAPTIPDTPASSFFVINGTVNAASDHEIVGSSAFPNFTTGAVDNYYSMAHSHVDNSPFAEGTASPADTGPIGQTAAAGQFQQPQYADARWPGDSGKATYGTQGQPYATAEAGEFRATADASEATNGLSGPGPGGSKTLPVPNGFDLRLRQALGAWKAKWQAPLGLEKPKKPTPAVTTPIATVTAPKVTVPKPRATTPTATVTTPIATVTTPTPLPTSGVSPAPPVTVPSATLPSASATSASRSLASAPVPPPASASTPADGESLLTSSTQATLVPDNDPAKTCKTATSTTATTKTAKTKAAKAKPAPCKTYTLVTSGESSLGRVVLGGGQIVIEGIHVTASIANDGTPTYKAAVSVASATIGGVPVTIDQDGVHVAGQGQGLPYQQASDALNGALKQAGIQLFLVAPEVTKTSSCDQTGSGTGTGTGTGTGSGTTTTSDQSSTGSTTSSCDQTGGGMCDQSGASTGGATGPALPGAPTTAPSDQSGTDTTPSPCDQSTTCDQAGSGTGTNTTTTTIPSSPQPGTTTTASSSNQGRQSGTTTTPSSCGGTGMTATTGSCSPTATAPGTTPGSSGQAGMTTPTSSSDPMGLNTGTSDSGEEKVTATGVHVVFTQPMSPPGVPAQFVEHILGEVSVDSLAVPATPLSNLDLSSSSSSFSSSSLSSRCGGHSRLTGSGGGLTAGGSSSAGGLTSAGSPAGSAFGSSSQPTAGSAGSSLPAAFAAALRKPLWLLLAYVLWQAIVIATGVSLWNWRKGEAS
jgi:hypothetical protein